MDDVVFWQDIVSPHMATLADELDALGSPVTYVAEAEMTPDRAQQGWVRPDLKMARLRLADGPREALSFLADFSPEAIHLTQGVRGNRQISAVIRAMRKRGARWGVIAETIDERFGLCPLKRLVYAWHLACPAKRPDFILAIGERTKPWFVDRGFPSERIFEFAYFLQTAPVGVMPKARPEAVFRFGFVGRLIRRKRVDLLIDALAGLPELPFQLVVIGSGPLEDGLRERGLAKLGSNRFRMLGRLTMDATRACMHTLDCLVLPSEHDGWGAVVSEALMAGVPVICSDACGSAGVVRVSSVGGVFPSGDVAGLRAQLRRLFEDPPGVERRQSLARWSQCLGSEAGASYLMAILNTVYHGADRPLPPWENGVFRPPNLDNLPVCVG
jgi:glycosyltransferase involved in cell wall biosynthesis